MTAAYIRYTMMFWLKKIGPMTGILARIGISMGAKVPPEFHVD